VRLSRDASGVARLHAECMCLGIPAQVVERQADGLAKVDFGGVRRPVSVAFTPNVEPGDWVLVHVGFALATIDEEEAHATLDLLGEAIEAELAS
jgi:hydrogenase expression/formation protein HypC